MSIVAAAAYLAAAVSPPAAAPVKQIDVSEAGRVLATLDDWRGIMFSQMVVIGVLILALLGVIGVVVWVATRRSANDQATLAALQDNTKAFGELAASVRALEMIAARRESEQA